MIDKRMKAKKAAEEERDLLEIFSQTPIGVFICALETVEISLRGHDDEEATGFADDLHKICDKLDAAMNTNKEKDLWLDEILDALDVAMLSDDELKMVFNSLAMYSDAMFEESEMCKGKAKENYLNKSDAADDVYNFIYYCSFKLDDDQVLYDALVKTFDETVETFSENIDEDDAYVPACLERVAPLIERHNRKAPFYEYFFGLLDSLPDDMRQTFYEEVLCGGIECLTYELEDKEDEYEGLDVDFSAYEKSLAALHQMRRQVQKRYGLKRF